ncbi:hypothetical protein [Ramlibacter humi]|uniref:DUF883 domain-containing protein n=1 Tax=Ramlibacter humi TaxID=2530451 RepID=A0A4Z0CCE6_9BURK|nr:hypothetical protein [Ramlibacter humi]TFZ07769.1 hypothetical protein EZ216_00985 [Ramlibacter humi]
MNSETSTSPLPASASTGGSNAGADSVDGTVRRVAQRAHDTVDRLEQTVSAGSDRLMDWHEEYGGMAREQVRENPLAAVGVSFLAGIVFAKLFL